MEKTELAGPFWLDPAHAQTCCNATAPGRTSPLTCTAPERHDGPHVAHTIAGSSGTVVIASWVTPKDVTWH